MYDPKTGVVTCSECGAFIGDTNGEGNFFSLIATKYCPECKAWRHKESIVAASRAYRKRKRTERKLKDEKLTLLEEENRLLRERVRELKNNQEEY